MLAVARTLSAEPESTGRLTYDGEHVTQVLEGPATVLDALVARISADPRRGRVRGLARKPIILRDFEDWSMGYLHDGRFNDAVAGLLIGALIVPRAIRLLRETSAVLLESTPPGLDLDAVREHLLGVEHVRAVHDLHASLVATGLPVVTAHLTVDDECFSDGHTARILDQRQDCLATHFPISVEHSTFQIEPASHRSHEHLGHA